MCSPLTSKRIFLVPIVIVIVAIQLLLVSSVSLANKNNEYLYHECLNSEGKYKPKSSYEESLNSLIKKIPEGTLVRGNENTFNDGIYAMLQCRGDSYRSKCRSCFITASSELLKRCSMDKAGIIWYDKCLFKYSSKRFFGKIDIKNKFALCSSKNVSDSRSFNEKTKALLTKLTVIATRSSNEFVLSATGEMKLGKKKLYAMVQCTKDIWPSTVCKKCLDEIIEWLPDSCDGKDGVTVMSGSCYFRYETYPFLDTVQ